MLSSDACFGNLGLSCRFEGGLRPACFKMSLGVGLECCHLMLAFRIWACLVNLKVAFAHLFFIMSLGIGRECCHLMLAFGIWACLVDVKVAFGHLIL